MHEEQGFLDQLLDHPEDDVTRLVYADWLEDHDDPRSAYLRAEVALARMVESDEGYANAEAELVRLSIVFGPLCTGTARDAIEERQDGTYRTPGRSIGGERNN